MLKFVKPTLNQEDKPTGPAGTHATRSEHGAANGAEGANGSEVTPLFARAVDVAEIEAAPPPMENSARSEIQRVRLDLLARETERLQQKLQVILEERRHDRAVIDSLRSQIEELTRQGIRMASRSEAGDLDADGDAELEKRIKPLLHTLLRMLEQAKKKSRAVAPSAGDVGAAGPGEDNEQVDDAWSQIDSARRDDPAATSSPPVEAAPPESAPPESAPPEPQAAPWDDSDSEDDIPRQDEGFVEVAKLLLRSGAEDDAAEAAESPGEPAKRDPATPREAADAATEKPEAKAPARGAETKEETGASSQASTGEPLLLGTQKTPRVKQAKSAPEARKLDRKPAERRDEVSAPGSETPQRAPRAARTEPLRAPSRPAARTSRQGPEATSREVTLRRAAEIVDRLGASGRSDSGPAGPAAEEDAVRAAVSAPAGSEREVAKPEKAPKVEIAPSSEVSAKPAIPEQRVVPAKPEVTAEPVVPAEPPVEAKPETKPVSKGSSAQELIREARRVRVASEEANRRRSEIKTTTPVARPTAPPSAGPEESAATGAEAPTSEPESGPTGDWSGIENDPIRAALPKCLTEPWDDQDEDSAALRWPFRKSRGQKAQAKPIGREGAARSPRREGAARSPRRGAGDGE